MKYTIGFNVGLLFWSVSDQNWPMVAVNMLAIVIGFMAIKNTPSRSEG